MFESNAFPNPTKSQKGFGPDGSGAGLVFLTKDTNDGSLDTPLFNVMIV